MKRKITITAIFLSLIWLGSFAQPKVYNKENTGSAFPLPPLPTLGQLPVVDPLTDPFMWSDGSGRSTNFSDWERRRNEIKAEIENYEIGTKPPKPDTLSATFTRGATAGTGTLRVIITRNGQTVTLTSPLSFPATGSGPWPAVIGMNNLNGSIPADIFTTRNIARVTFSHNNVTTYGNPRNTDPFYRLYPDQNIDNAGQYSAWAWGVSRIIDGLELIQDSLAIDLTHLAVTGCSYAGKMALFAGAFDERVALTIAQESGGGGAPAWRVSEFGGDVEKLGATDHNWFKESMFSFAGLNVPKLPYDHHELMAMVAPRALLVTGNTDFFWLSNPANYVTSRATKEIYKTLGISDRFGFYIDGQHGHCAVPTAQRPAIAAFVDKFLLDKADVNTDTVTVNPYPSVNYERWYKWWGTGNPVFPDEAASIKIWLETECGTVGSNWDIFTDPLASKGAYVMSKLGLNSTGAAPKDTAPNKIVIPFTIDVAGTYNFLGRAIGPTATDDSYWVKVDNGTFVSANGLTSTDWQWGRMTIADLTPGPHTFTITYREDGAKLDKILITTSNASVISPEFVGPNCGVAPTIAPNQVFSVSETAANSAVVGNVSATDLDAGNVIQKWKITGGTGAAAFAINAGTGQLTVLNNSLLDFESGTRSFTLTLTVTDGYFTSAVETVTVNLNNVNDNAPVVTPSQVFSVSEAAAKNAAVGVAAATDADDTNQPGFTQFRNWAIIGGTGAAVFGITPNTGKIWVKDQRWLDFETTTSYTLNLRVSDGPNTSQVVEAVANVTNVNDNKPTVSVNQRIIFENYAWNGQSVGLPVQKSDPDDTNEPGFTTFGSFKIIGGDGSSAFAIDGVTGQLSVKNASLINGSTRRFYELWITVSDGKYIGGTDDVQVVVSTYVFVCHAGQSHYVQRRAAAGHVAHGDTPGECAGSNAVTNRGTLVPGPGNPLTENLRVYPNPIRDRFTVVLGANELHIRKIELVDIAGRVLMQIPISGRSGILNIEIPRETLTRGIYMIRMQGDKVVTQKVMIE